MTNINERISVYTVLSTATLEEQSFDALLLVDHADVVDAYRVLWVTPASYADDLTSGTSHFEWVETYFSQNRRATQVCLGKWKSATETPAEAIAAIQAIDNDWWCVAAIPKAGASLSVYQQQLSIMAAIEATKNKFCVLVSRDANVAVDGYSADIASVAQAFGYVRSALIFTEHTNDGYNGFVDAAIMGNILPASPPGSVAWSWQKIVGVNESGKDTDNNGCALSLSKRSAIEEKYANHVESLNRILVLRKAIDCSNVPIHLIQAMDSMNSSIQSQIYTYMMNVDNPSFSTTIGAVEGIVRANIELAVQNGVLIDTVDDPIVYDFPSLSEITAAQKASGTLTCANCYRATLNYPVCDVVVYGTWQI